ncbi:MAG: ABC transporter permease [Xanthomonadales bacterium]|nr:ABC transporter permease [Xanthomonadales bacterium]
MAAHKSDATSKTRKSRGRLGVWREHHAWCAHAAAHRLAARPLGTLLAIAVMGLAMALPLAFWMLLGNAQHVAHTLGDGQGLSVFLHPDQHADDAKTLATTLRQRGDVASVRLKTPDQGATELAAMQGFGDALQALGDNPLPWVLLIQPQTEAKPSAVDALVTELRALPQVDLVQDQGAWRERAQALLALGTRTLLLLAGLMAAAALLVVGYTVRQDIQSRADEIAVLQRLGASHRFVLRPYLYAGSAYGLAAGISAALLVLLVEWLLAAPVARLAASYGGHLAVTGLSTLALLAMPLIAAALGWLGARLAAHELGRSTH